MIRPPRSFKLSQQERERLITLKRSTKIQQWNVLCRWAFCLSLAEPSTPPEIEVRSDSSVEMTWQTFGGADAELYWALLLMRCEQDGMVPADTRSAARVFRLHVYRGIGYLVGNRSIHSIRDLVRLASARRA